MQINFGFSSSSYIDSRRSNLQLLAIILFIIVIFRFFYLQVIKTESYQKISERNRISIDIITPFRGVITDRNGVLLAENIGQPSLEIIPSEVANIEQVLTKLEEYIKLSARVKESFLYLYHSVSKKSTQPIPLITGIDERALAKIAENQYRLPGVNISIQMQRFYPYGELFSHIVGYTGRINNREQKLIDSARYKGTYSIGKTGIEKQYEDYLLGNVGLEQVETNVAGVIQRVIRRNDAVGGKKVELFIDVDLQQYVGDLLSGYIGAVTAIDIATGGVLAMVSNPTFNTNLLVQGISNKDFNNILENIDKPMLNRNIIGQYPPGSVVKPSFAMAGLDSQLITTATVVVDEGFYQLANTDRKYRDWKPEGHGNAVDLRQAIVESCDIYFYDLGYKMGIKTMKHYATEFGFGVKTGIDLPYEKSGYFPNEYSEKNFGGHLVNLGIGQGEMLVTPLQIANNIATIARRGVKIIPRIVKSIDSIPTVKEQNQQIVMENAYWDYVHNSMIAVLHSYKGTAGGVRLKDNGIVIASKTGTAQKVGIDQDDVYRSEAIAKRLRDHAWFMAFAPANDPKIAVAVLIENGEKSTNNAAPIARDTIYYWLEQKLSSLAQNNQK